MPVRPSVTLIAVLGMAVLAAAGGAPVRAQTAAAQTCASPTATAVPVGAASLSADDPSRGYICVERATTTGSVARADDAEAWRPVGAMDGK